jgi:transposase
MRRTWLRGRENVHKRYLIHVAGHNLGILMRQLIGAGTPKEAAARGRVLLLVVHSEEILAMVLFGIPDADGPGDFGVFIVAVTANPT